MSEDRGYDNEWTAQAGPSVRRRLGYSHERGEVTAFVVQLEYHFGDTWTPVVRYDHNPANEAGHDVTTEGLHIDIYRDGEKDRQEFIAPPMPAGVALDLAEDHLAANAKQFIQRFERWHGINSQ